DTVVTSAFSKKFPSGLPVGRVESVDMGKSPSPEAVIQLTAPIAALEWTAIYPHLPPQTEDLIPDPEPKNSKILTSPAEKP
ncbi:MAG: rod shape-determining protein MreC, partial [Alkalinema sp. CAN_BIN05]|nr:rod shape-determining protein MreC [Alkalinema sp. CAN_BIN05]